MYTRRPQAVQLILQLPSIEYNYTILYIYVYHYFLLPSLCPYLWIIHEAPQPTAPIVPCPEKVDQQVRRYDLSYGSTVPGAFAEIISIGRMDLSSGPRCG